MQRAAAQLHSAARALEGRARERPLIRRTLRATVLMRDQGFGEGGARRCILRLSTLSGPPGPRPTLAPARSAAKRSPGAAPAPGSDRWSRAGCVSWPRGSLGCAAQALDATALRWHLRPRRSARACAITSAKRASLPRAQPSPRQHPAPPARRRSSSQVARARVTPDSRDLGVRRWRSVARAYACRPSAVALRSLVRSAVLNHALVMRRRAAGVAAIAAGIVCSASPR
jgi:hypothetical protein